MNKWLPDWTNPANYPVPQKTSMTEWAWEFLRRNPSYQADYKKLMADLGKIGFPKAREDLIFIEKGKFTRVGHETQDLSPDRKSTAEKILHEGNQLIRPLEEKYMVSLIGFPEGVPKGIPDPSESYEECTPLFTVNNYLKIYDFFPKINISYFNLPLYVCSLPEKEVTDYAERLNEEACRKNKCRTAPITARPRALTVEISLERSIEEQIRVIKKLVTTQQKKLKLWGMFDKKGNDKAEQWGGYLRLLDAIESGSEKEEIYATLFGLSNYKINRTAEYRYRDWKNSAEKYRDVDYLTIVHTQKTDKTT